jgi:hypothetical protein
MPEWPIDANYRQSQESKTAKEPQVTPNGCTR